MYLTSIIKLTAIALAATATSTPVRNAKEIIERNYYVYATFYDDNACTENGGIAVSTSNPGCLENEIGRNSIYFQSGAATTIPQSLIFSPGTTCDCQNYCIQDIDGDAAYGPYCYDLSGSPTAQSYRFVSDTDYCPSNQC